jgi:hypothetical protein
MVEVLTLLAVVVFFAAIMAGFAWLGIRVRRGQGRVSDAYMGPFQEIWHPAAHRARLTTEVVEERMVPMPSADDKH